MPENSIQNSILTFAPHDLVGLVARLRPFMGQLGTTPAIPIPDSHNAGDFGAFLIGAPHEYAITADQLAEHRTDGHMDIDAVRAGAILICPVKAEGGGVYMGDMHAMQGDGEIAGHTADVAGTVTLQVHLVKGWTSTAPSSSPSPTTSPSWPARSAPKSASRAEAARRQAGGSTASRSQPPSPSSAPAPTSTAATDNGLERAARLLGMSVPEVKNRATITGAIEIGRHPGVVQVTFRAPLSIAWRRLACSASPATSTATDRVSPQTKTGPARLVRCWTSSCSPLHRQRVQPAQESIAAPVRRICRQFHAGEIVQ
jgi:formamidase